jgi:amino-acid N-acetyltransferase
MALIRQSVKSEELVRRTRADILQHLDDYWVMEIDRTLVACVALHLYTEFEQAEIACLYVHKDHEGQGYGRKLIAFAEQLAGEKGMKQIVALSTQAYNYLQQKGGFVEVAPEVLPPERRKKWEASGRNSKVLLKPVSQKPVVVDSSPT